MSKRARRRSQYGPPGLRARNNLLVAPCISPWACERIHCWSTRWWISPEGAACLAALPQLLDRGLLKRGERVVVVNTGSAGKYLPAIRYLLD